MQLRPFGIACLLLGLGAAFPALASAPLPGPPPAPTPPKGMIVKRDLAYGEHHSHSLDVYRPAAAKRAPVIFMVHGQDWLKSDKSFDSVVGWKVARWVSRGFIVIAANYRQSAFPDTSSQVNDVASAIAFAQKRAPSWGGDPSAFVLMGHYAGGHLAALLAADPRPIVEAGGRKPLGAVLLDATAYDVAAFMGRPRNERYKRVFGDNPLYWSWTISPIGQVSADTLPLAAVCSLRREEACEDAETFVERATAEGVRAQLLRVELSTEALNAELGAESEYTAAVEEFMRGLDARIGRRLARRSGD